MTVYFNWISSNVNKLDLIEWQQLIGIQYTIHKATKLCIENTKVTVSKNKQTSKQCFSLIFFSQLGFVWRVANETYTHTHTKRENSPEWLLPMSFLFLFSGILNVRFTGWERCTIGTGSHPFHDTSKNRLISLCFFFDYGRIFFHSRRLNKLISHSRWSHGCCFF